MTVALDFPNRPLEYKPSPVRRPSVPSWGASPCSPAVCSDHGQRGTWRWRRRRACYPRRSAAGAADGPR